MWWKACRLSIAQIASQVREVEIGQVVVNRVAIMLEPSGGELGRTLLFLLSVVENAL